MIVKCKFLCKQVHISEYSHKIYFEADTSSNSDYAKYTPYGKLEFECNNESLYGYFIPGKVYSVNIEEDNNETK